MMIHEHTEHSTTGGSLKPGNQNEYLLAFEPVCSNGVSMAIPCDADGNVQVELLTDAQRHSYMLAQAMVGQEVHAGVVVRLH